MLDRAGTRAADEGADRLRVDVWTTNEHLQHYYRRQGFTHIRTVVLPDNPSGALFQRPAEHVPTLHLPGAESLTADPGPTRAGGPMATPLLHLGLLVRDQRRSLRFYTTYFGFDAARARRYPDETVIVRNAQGFDLALHPGDPPERLPAFVHFGFRLPDADAVGALLARMEADGVPIVERWDEPGYAAFKCLDPDGWRVEAYWELVS